MIRFNDTVSYSGNRGLLALIISVFIVSGFVPLIGVVVSRSSYAPFSDIGHFGALCLVFLHTLLSPVNFVLLIMLSGGVLYAVWDRLSAVRQMRLTLESLESRTPIESETFGLAAMKADIPLSALHIVPGLPNPAFTVGFINRRIYISESLVDALSFPELVAVLKHERVHYERRDPLRLSGMRFISCMLFWVPAVRRLSEDLADQAEFYADSQAAGAEPLSLASAILALASWPDLNVGQRRVAVGFARQCTVERRVRVLLGEKISFKSNLTRGSIYSAALVMSVMWTSGIVMSHPMPQSASQSTNSIKQQFDCLQSWVIGNGDSCPHLGGTAEHSDVIHSGQDSDQSK